jgi:hypothetical protein
MVGFHGVTYLEFQYIKHSMKTLHSACKEIKITEKWPTDIHSECHKNVQVVNSHITTLGHTDKSISYAYISL